MTADRDPDRRRPGPPHPGFAPLPQDVAVDVCKRCSVLVPATDKARQNHMRSEGRKS